MNNLAEQSSKKQRGEKTISYPSSALLEGKPASSVFSSYPSRVEASYVVLNPRLSYLFLTKIHQLNRQ